MRLEVAGLCMQAVPHSGMGTGVDFLNMDAHQAADLV